MLNVKHQIKIKRKIEERLSQEELKLTLENYFKSREMTCMKVI